MTQKRDKQIGAVAALAILTIILFTIYQPELFIDN